MNENNPWYLFHHDSPGWLKRRHEKNETVLPADLVRIILANDELIPDPIVREYVLKALRGELQGKRGRKRGSARRLKELYALTLYDELVPRLQARRERQRKKGIKTRAVHYSPSELALEVIRRRIGIDTMEGMRNLISKLKKEQNSG